MVSIRPLASRLRMRMSGRSFLDEASDVIEVAPACELDFVPPVCLPDEIERMTDVYGLSHSDTKRQLEGRGIYQSPTRLFCMEDVVIADRTIMTPRAIDVLAPAKRRMILTDKTDHLDEALLCSNYYTELFFGHWVYDGWQREMLARDRGVQPIWLDRTPWQHEPGYRAMLGTERHAVSQAHIDRLWISDDGGLVPTRMERIRRLRQQIRTASPSRGSQRVFLTRGTTGVARKLVNEEEIARALSQRGFTTLNPETEEPSTIAAVLHDARIVVMVEGSAGVHPIMAAPEDAGLLFIQPASRFNLIYHAHCGAYGQRFGYTVADDAGDGDIRQPLDRLLRTIDLMEKAVDG